MHNQSNNWMTFFTFLGVVATFYSIWWNGSQNRALEKLQFESSIIVKVYETSPDSIRESIRRLVNARVLDQNSERVRSILADTTLDVHFPANVIIENPKTVQYNGSEIDNYWTFQVVDKNGNGIQNVEVKTVLGAMLVENASFSRCVTDSFGVGNLAIPNRNFFLVCSKPNYRFVTTKYLHKLFSYPKTISPLED